MTARRRRPFDRARRTSWQLRANTNRGWLLAGGAALALGVAALRRMRDGT